MTAPCGARFPVTTASEPVSEIGPQANHFAVVTFCVDEILTERLSGHAQAVLVQQIAEFREDRRDTARCEKTIHQEFARRAEINQERYRL